jgi:uncharacterized membrane protein (UPF0127 family)
MRATLAAALGAFLIFAGASFAQTGPQPRLRTTPLTIQTATGEHRFTAEMAITPEQTSRGLMFRESVPDGEGMLFDFGRDEVVTMWMRNTPVSLDMIFIRRDGRVATVAENTTPLSEAIISSRTPVRAVFEVRAGTARRLAVRPGDQVRNVLFGNAP